VVGILIINGILLAGPITRKMMESLTHGIESMHWKWLLVADAAGAVSITSWVTITFIDFFASLTLGYWQLIVIYVSVLTAGFAGHALWQWLDKEAPPLPHEQANHTS